MKFKGFSQIPNFQTKLSYLFVVSPPLNTGEAVRSSFMLIWTGNGLRTPERDVGDWRNFCLLEYTNTTRNKKRRIKVTAVKTPINTSTSTGWDDIPIPKNTKNKIISTIFVPPTYKPSHFLKTVTPFNKTATSCS